MINKEMYKKEMDSFALSDEQKSLLKVKMYQADETEWFRERRQRPKIKMIKVAASALALALIAGGTYIGVSIKSKADKNPFIITANASEISEKYKDAEISENAIAVYSSSAGMGWLFDGYSEDGTYLKDGYADYFISYDMDALRVTGENIETVTFKTNKKGLYFTVTPYADMDWDFYSEEVQKEAEKGNAEKAKYIFGALTNSQYTRDELNKYNDGIGREFFADSFTYKNTDKSSTLNMDNAVALMIESDHSNKEIADNLKELRELEKQSVNLRDLAKDGAYDGEKDRIYHEMELIGERVIKIMLQNAAINVDVRYTDGSTESRILDIDTVNFTGSKGPLLTLGELEWNEEAGEYK